MTDVPDDAVHAHNWTVQDVYWAAPPDYFGNKVCGLCGKRDTGLRLTEQEVRDWMALQPEYSDDE